MQVRTMTGRARQGTDQDATGHRGEERAGHGERAPQATGGRERGHRGRGQKQDHLPRGRGGASGTWHIYRVFKIIIPAHRG